ncbi:MAG: MlaA family lipoprotein, partial [Rhodocyclaceae bacterium]|nr:MlaA family lipoprotein [Rhodocyclaceae bacterium]
MTKRNFLHARLALCVVSAAVLTGCASAGPGVENDPLEGYNRAMFRFNDAVDRAVVKPVAQGYDSIAP